MAHQAANLPEILAMEILSAKPKAKTATLDPQMAQTLSFLVEQAVASVARSILSASNGQIDKMTEALNNLANKSLQQPAPVTNIVTEPRKAWAGDLDIIRDAKGDIVKVRATPTA